MEGVFNRVLVEPACADAERKAFPDAGVVAISFAADPTSSA